MRDHVEYNGGMATALIALGSNLGDRRDYLERALVRLRDVSGIHVTKVSTFHETAPVGGPPEQGNFLNGAAEIETSRSPHDLLRTLAEVENARSAGRAASAWGPRTIDLDLLLYDDLILDDPTLTVPHPRLHERGFVLEPLAEIAPQAVHPLLGETIAALRDRRQHGAASSGAAAAAGTGARAGGAARPRHRLHQRHRPGHCRGAGGRRRRHHRPRPPLPADRRRSGRAAWR